MKFKVRTVTGPTRSATLSVPSTKKRFRGSRGPAPTVSAEGATRTTIWVPNPFKQRILDFNKRADKLGVPRVHLSTVYREGGKLYLQQKEKEMQSAKSGSLHAKRRS